LQVDAGVLIDCLAELVAGYGVIREDIPGADAEPPTVGIYLATFHRAEISLAGQLRTLLHTAADRMSAFRTVDWDKALSWLHRHTHAERAPEQQAAVKLALTQLPSVGAGEILRALLAPSTPIPHVRLTQDLPPSQPLGSGHQRSLHQRRGLPAHSRIG
jgi:hypothetical protein